jgi:hypothetical protein
MARAAIWGGSSPRDVEQFREIPRVLIRAVTELPPEMAMGSLNRVQPAGQAVDARS